MDAAALNAITDVEILRALVREQIDTIAQRDALIEKRDRTIAYKDARSRTSRTRSHGCAGCSTRRSPNAWARREMFDAAMAAELDELHAPAGPAN
ncbi:MAG TPA: hypothetical protein VF422_11900 [Dokdonella sp.]